MKIEYRLGNLFEDPSVRFLAHCCNAQRVQRSGFAKELRERYPGAYQAYYDEPSLDMGKIIPYEAPDSRVIFHLIGQKFYGRDGARYVSYDAIAEGIETLDTIAPSLGMDSLAMPLIGAGLAGGSWAVLSRIIEEYSTNFRPVVYYLPNLLPNGLDITTYTSSAANPASIPSG